MARRTSRGRLVVEERQERVAVAPGDWLHLVEERAAEHHSTARGHLEAVVAVLGEDELAAVVIAVEPDRNGEAAVRRARRRVVAMGHEEPAVGRPVAGDDVALDAGGAELERLADGGDDASPDAVEGGGPQRVVLGQLAVGPALAIEVQPVDRPAPLLAHRARLHGVVAAVVLDQGLAQACFEHVGDDEHRRVRLRRHRRRLGQPLADAGDDLGHVRLGVCGGGAHQVEAGGQAQSPVEDQGARDIRRTGSLRCAQRSAGSVVEVPQAAEAGQRLPDAPGGLVGRVDRDAHDRARVVVEDVPMGEEGLDRRPRRRLRGRAEGEDHRGPAAEVAEEELRRVVERWMNHGTGSPGANRPWRSAVCMSRPVRLVRLRRLPSEAGSPGTLFAPRPASTPRGDSPTRLPTGKHAIWT